MKQTYLIIVKDEERFETMLDGLDTNYTKIAERTYNVQLSEEQADKWWKQFSHWMWIRNEMTMKLGA